MKGKNCSQMYSQALRSISIKNCNNTKLLRLQRPGELFSIVPS